MTKQSRAESAIDRFAKQLAAYGAEVLSPTSVWELLRFRCMFGVGVVYRNKRGGETWNAEAKMARDHIKANKGNIAPVIVRTRRSSDFKRGQILKVLERDGGNCFFCGKPLCEDVTLEHLVSLNHGGPHHLSNVYCAHDACNQAAGHMSAPEKVAMAIKQRANGGTANA